MIVSFTVAALGDLEDIGDFIARDNPERAESFVAEIEQKPRGFRFPGCLSHR